MTTTKRRTPRLPRIYTKADVQTHSLHLYGGDQLPAINVKVHNWPDVNEIMAKFNCTEKVADKAIEWWFETAQETFWDDWCMAIKYEFDTPNGDDEIVPLRNGYPSKREYFYFPQYGRDYREHKIKVYSAGRSGGWLVVEGLTPIDTWDAIDLAHWRHFERGVKRDIEYATSLENVIDMIESNDWIEMINAIDG